MWMYSLIHHAAFIFWSKQIFLKGVFQESFDERDQMQEFPFDISFKNNIWLNICKNSPPEICHVGLEFQCSEIKSNLMFRNRRILAAFSYWKIGIYFNTPSACIHEIMIEQELLEYVRKRNTILTDVSIWLIPIFLAPNKTFVVCYRNDESYSKF